MIKALIFDLDDTLVVEKASAETALLQTCAAAQERYGIDPAALHATLRQTCRRRWHRSPARAYAVEVGISSWEALWAEFEGDDENLKILKGWAPEYRTSSWQEALCCHNVDDVDFALELADAFPLHRRKLHVVYDDVRPMLDELRAVYRLGLLTNGVLDLQRRKIAGSDLEDYFHHIVVSGEVGFGKPDVRIFQTMLSSLDVAPDEAIMIGNSLVTDVQGAQAAGIRAIWLNRDGESRGAEVTANYEISDLYGLRNVLAGYQNSPEGADV
jgi:putative hydrolase of the HAD superfamily